MSNKIILALAFYLLVTGFGFSRNGTTQGEDKCTLNVSIATENNGKPARFTVLTTLFSQGTALRSTELLNGGSSNSVVWRDLDAGPYEVRFESKGYGTITKRITLSPDAPTTVRVESITKSDEVWGNGPTLSDLQNRIVKLESDVSVLNQKVTALAKKQ
ncbi:hypothetical protein BH11ARM1_BH11ARM1_12610 [soil metagenome]